MAPERLCKFLGGGDEQILKNPASFSKKWAYNIKSQCLFSHVIAYKIPDSH